jgi:hypothetical protein
MQLRIGSLEIGARLEPNPWGASLGGLKSWLTAAGSGFMTWGEDWRRENVGAAALIGPVTLRTELHQHSDSIRVVDVLGAFWEVAKALPTLLEDKDPLAEPEFDEMVRYDPVAAGQHLADVVAQYEAFISREALAEIPDSALESMFGTSNREEILRMVKGRNGEEAPCWVSAPGDDDE